MRVLRRGRLADGSLVDITVADGRIDAVRPHDPGHDRANNSDEVVRRAGTDGADGADGGSIDLEEWLVLPALTEPHAHVDKALTADRAPNHKGDLDGAIEAWLAAAASGVVTHDDMIARIQRALDSLLLNGVTAVRSHINIGTGADLVHAVAAQEAIAPYRDLMDIQLVALTHSPFTGPHGSHNQRMLDAAMAMGLDIVGSCPHLEDDAPTGVRVSFDCGTRHGADLDLHTDETLEPDVLTVLDMVAERHRSRFEGRVTASHCVSLSMQPPDVQYEVAARIAGAEIAVIALPHTNLFLQGHDIPIGSPRGLTPISVLSEAGVLVAAGGDNVQDPFNPVGRSDPLETASLLVMASHVSPELAFDMVSNNARRTLGLEPVRFRPGDPADFLVIDSATTRAAIADAPVDRKVFHRGRLVASSRSNRAIVRQPS